MRHLALDVGSVRIGVAMSDPMGIFAQPLEVIDRRRTDAITRIVELVEEHEVQQVLVGRPMQLDGRDGLAVAATEAFVAACQQRLTVPLVWWDERLTTAAAERAMIADGVRRDNRRQRIDKVAAALILQSYLDSQRP